MEIDDTLILLRSSSREYKPVVRELEGYSLILISFMKQIIEMLKEANIYCVRHDSAFCYTVF